MVAPFDPEPYQISRPETRFGSEAGIAACFGHVRYTPKSRQTQRRLVLPAKSQQQTSSFGVRL